MRALLFDIGGTNMRVAVATTVRDFSRAVIVPTPKRFSDGIRVLGALCKQLSGRRTVDIAVGGIAGTLARDRSMLINSPHISQWIRKPAKTALTKTIGAPVLLENDADLVGLGEAVYGAGLRHRIVAYITVSTGVGGTRIVDRHLDTVAYGFEPGHMVIDPHGPTYHTCRTRGILESMVSGTAVKKKFRRHPRTVTSPHVWKQQAKILAYGLVNVAVMWSPDVIVLGGSMLKSPGISLLDVRRELRANLKGFYPMPLVAKGTLQDIGGLFGALHLARTVAHRTSPS